MIVIIGAGVAGLTLGNLLLRRGTPCLVVEKRSREYVEHRQRAGVIDSRAVRMFRAWGLEQRVVGGVPSKPALTFRIHGRTRVLELDPIDHDDGRFCSQQILVRNLIDVYTQDGGDLRWETDVAIESVDPPRVRVAGQVLECELIAGCDGDRGISRAAMPELRRYEHEFGYAWLTILANVPAAHQGLMAIHERGFAGQFMRGPQASRFYLQCGLDDRNWPDDRIWAELETRFGEVMTRGPIASTQLVPIRSVVHAPMSSGGLYLLGDAAHIIPPMSAKGMNLAMHDAEMLADPVTRARYSELCLAHVWRYQAFAMWWTNLIHDAGQDSFRGEIARAELERLFTSPVANRGLSQFLAGLA